MAKYEYVYAVETPGNCPRCGGEIAEGEVYVLELSHKRHTPLQYVALCYQEAVTALEVCKSCANDILGFARYGKRTRPAIYDTEGDDDGDVTVENPHNLRPMQETISEV